MPFGPSFRDGKQMQIREQRNRTLTYQRDESFNSITGLNGSGKSNILDSICFVLGITNMTTVRAQNLQVCAD
jgi:structural maintenance of chromosome 2